MITKTTDMDSITIKSSGHVEIRTSVIILDDDGSELARKYHRRVISPEDDISQEPQELQRICKIAREQ